MKQGLPTRKTYLQGRQGDTIMLVQTGDDETERASSSDAESGVRTGE